MHTVNINIIADQVVNISQQKINIHDIDTIIFDNKLNIKEIIMKNNEELKDLLELEILMALPYRKAMRLIRKAKRKGPRDGT